jgi:hypothetical protein
MVVAILKDLSSWIASVSQKVSFLSSDDDSKN